VSPIEIVEAPGLTTSIGLSKNAPDYSIALSASTQTDALRRILYRLLFAPPLANIWLYHFGWLSGLMQKRRMAVFRFRRLA
jgi:hypothetical protein